MDNKREELKNSTPTILLHTLNEKLNKGYINMQGNCKIVNKINIESQNHDYSSSLNLHHQRFNSTQRNDLIPKIDIRKAYGKDTITWIFYMEQFFDINQVVAFKRMTLATLYLLTYQTVWY